MARDAIHRLAFALALRGATAPAAAEPRRTVAGCAIEEATNGSFAMLEKADSRGACR